MNVSRKLHALGLLMTVVASGCGGGGSAVAPSMPASSGPTMKPSSAPSVSPTASPTMPPTLSPTIPPSVAPSASPSNAPSAVPTVVNNAALIPPISNAPCSAANQGSPAPWLSSLIMAEVRIESATSTGTFMAAESTPQGSFPGAQSLLDHFAEVGVNGLWVDPVFDRPYGGGAIPSDGGYGNYGLQAIWPELYGSSTPGGGPTTDPTPGFQAAQAFVAAAHQRNIRVFWDVVVWGTAAGSPLLTQDPNFYIQPLKPDYDGYKFDWSGSKGSEALMAWYTAEAVQLVQSTGADGFRVDEAPSTSGYYFGQVRSAVCGSLGFQAMYMSETPNTDRSVFDLEEHGVNMLVQKQPHNEAFLQTNIVSDFKTGAQLGDPGLQQAGEGGGYQYYTSNLLDHDDTTPFVQGNRVNFGYTAIFTPAVPVWWIGEEWNNPQKTAGSSLYYNTIDWDAIPANRAFYEDAKRYITIRRTYPDIFDYFAPSARNANIVAVQSTIGGSPNTLQAYARYRKDHAVLVVPNDTSAAASVQVNPYAAQTANQVGTGSMSLMGLGDAQYAVTDLMTGQQVATISSGTPSFTVSIQPTYLGVYLVAASTSTSVGAPARIKAFPPKRR